MVATFILAGCASAASPGDDEIVARIDSLIVERAAAAGVEPAPLAGDAEFLRRVSLDLRGVVPQAAEVREFLRDHSPDKRARIVESMLASEDCTTRLARRLLEQTTGERATFVWFANLFEYFEWLKDSLRADRSYADIVRDVITARGQLDENGAVNFLMLHKARPDHVTAAIGRSFLGSSVGCAQCHDHPTRPWRREQFWGVAAFFGRTHSYLVTNGDHGITDARFGRLAMPPLDRPESILMPIELDRTEPAVVPRWLDGTPADSDERLREQLAAFLVADPAFARNAVNRSWASLFGRALAEPIDDVGDDASHPELLDELARWFETQRFDLRALLRALVATTAYQRAGTGDGDERLFVRALPRPLDIDQLRASVLRASGATFPRGACDVPDEAAGVELPPFRGSIPVFAGAMQMMTPDVDAAAKAVDPAWVARLGRYYVDGLVPELLGGAPDGARHWLVRQNGMQRFCNDAAARAAAGSDGAVETECAVESLWLAFLSRPPHPDERALAAAFVAAAPTQRQGFVDVAWALMNSLEFSHNH